MHLALWLLRLPGHGGKVLREGFIGYERCELTAHVLR